MSFLTKMVEFLDNNGFGFTESVVTSGYYNTLKYIERKYGEVFFGDDKIYCMVNQDKIDKILKRYGRYNFFLEGLNNYEKLEELDLGKEICYIFDGLVFDEEISLVNLNNTEVVFKNCVFNRPIELKEGCIVSFINNTYFDKYGYYEGRAYSFLYGNCYYLKFINENFINSHEDINPSRFSICVYSKNIDIINSNIEVNTSARLNGNDVKNDGGIYLESKRLVMNNSKIFASDILLNCEDVILSGKNSVVGSNRVSLVNNKDVLIRSISVLGNGDELEIKTPNFIHNDVLAFEEFGKRMGERTYKFINSKVYSHGGVKQKVRELKK